jgi:hypothetical protein
MFFSDAGFYTVRAVAVLEIQLDIAAMRPYAERDQFNTAELTGEVGANFGEPLLQRACGYAELVKDTCTGSHFDELKRGPQNTPHLRSKKT